MVCARCIKVVTENLRNIGLEVESVRLGEAEVQDPVSGLDMDAIRKALEADGFELIRDQREVLAERVKHVLIHRLEQISKKESVPKLSEDLSNTLNLEYSTISKTFSQLEEVTINSYFIRLKIEKAKELVEYGTMSFKEIAYHLGYSSHQHLSGQFREVTGMSMSDYRLQNHKKRDSLDEIL